MQALFKSRDDNLLTQIYRLQNGGELEVNSKKEYRYVVNHINLGKIPMSVREMRDVTQIISNESDYRISILRNY